ncbi:putative serine/threonine-protein kinase At1g54610 isoform X1 [Nicotiana tabacum]|uniref:Serine/threonine-protein kinase At1g54610 isoform X1 n=2 Tax=Nicotiana tabacum TaxID=4097 RepID=A0A1S4CKM3_TOBAC|nr:PREDICTED: probable serine/threonine-protein kinase At1g54610 isoform X1 [Nicotiana tabacum]
MHLFNRIYCCRLMSCICSKGSSTDDYVVEHEKEKEIQVDKSSVQLVAPSVREEIKEIVNPKIEKPMNSKLNVTSETNVVSVPAVEVDGNEKTRSAKRPKEGRLKRQLTMDIGLQRSKSWVVSMPHSAEGELSAAGWPLWLSSVAQEAIQGWVPRSAESFEKLNKIGQGTYSNVYKARDLKTNKIVAMKKVKFVNMDPESVRFMAREIFILRRLDHPNVMKLEALVTSRISGSLYLVFEYMEHDLAGLAAAPGIKFTEPQIKCYTQQMLRGLEHCHSRGVLHRDIKGSNLLIGDNGVLKIGDFGLATTFEPNQKQPLTSRVVTLWYRAPELLLGATEYGVAIDMWSAGCILAELFAGKPIMPGRTEVEQMHKIFKLCGSPSEEYWRKSKLPHATSFKPQNPYKRCIADTFKDFPPSALALVDVLLSIEPEKRGTASSALNSEFFKTKPLPCDPYTLPKYPPSKEYDAKVRDHEARRRKAKTIKGHGGESTKKSPRQSKEKLTTEFNAHKQGQPSKSISVKYNPLEDNGTGFSIEPPILRYRNRLAHSNSVIHPNTAGYTWSNKVKEDSSAITERAYAASQHGVELLRQGSHKPRAAGEFSSIRSRRDDRSSFGDSTVYVPKRSRRILSGPLVPAGGSMEDMLKEHERQIQEAVRKARQDKTRTKNN